MVVEDARIDELKGRHMAVAVSILVDQTLIWICGLRVSVEIVQVAVARCGVPVEVDLFDVFAVIALSGGQSEGSLLEDRIVSIPHSQSETEPLKFIADSAKAVLAPTEGACTGLIMREIVPGIAVGAVVLAHGAPRAVGQIGAPQSPVLLPRTLVRKTQPFGVWSAPICHVTTSSRLFQASSRRCGFRIAAVENRTSEPVGGQRAFPLVCCKPKARHRTCIGQGGQLPQPNGVQISRPSRSPDKASCRRRRRWWRP